MNKTRAAVKIAFGVGAVAAATGVLPHAATAVTVPDPNTPDAKATTPDGLRLDLPATEAGTAYVNGRVVTMDEAWKVADNCVVYADHVTKCFKGTEAAEKDKEVRMVVAYERAVEQGFIDDPGTEVKSGDGVRSMRDATPCHGDPYEWLYISNGDYWEDSNGWAQVDWGTTTRVLHFQDQSVTQNLSDYSFDNQTQSYNAQPISCNTSAFKGSNGTGDAYKYFTAGTWKNLPSSWVNNISSIRIHNS